MAETSQLKDYVKTAVRAIEDKKGEDVRIIDISGVSIVADYFIIANGSSPLQVQAIADNVEEELAKAGLTEHKTEGYQSAGWILLDYGDIVIHIFSKEDRLFYDLERIWRDGKEIDPASLDE